MTLDNALRLARSLLDGDKRVVFGTSCGDVNPLAPPYSFLISRELLQALVDATHETWKADHDVGA